MAAQRKKLTDEDKARFREEAKTKLDQFTKSLAGQMVDLIMKGQTEEWTKPWENRPLAGLPRNPVSGHLFSGANMLSLSMYMLANQTNDPRFCTFKQAASIGEEVHVKKGAKGVVILRPLPVQIDDQDDQDNEERILNGEAPKSADDPSKTRTVYFFRPAKVFHASQIENMPPLELSGKADWHPHAMLERLVKASQIPVTHGFNQAAYFPGRDVIRMPDKDAFASEAVYYASLMHEWYHGTGHPTRENREFGDTMQFNGLKSYAEEELRAESFSALVSAALGLPYKLTTGAEYLKIWNGCLENDPKTIVAQAVQASKMLETVMAVSRDEQPQAAWFPEKATWPPMEDRSEDDVTILGIDLVAMHDFSDEDPFAELDDLDFGPSM